MKTIKQTDKPWKRLYLFMTTFGIGLAMVVSTPQAFLSIAFTKANLINLVGQILTLGSFLAVLVTVIQIGRNPETQQLIDGLEKKETK